ncbi:MAG: hypothetical protein ACYSWP_00145 [Planctomycetota bacterium]|jgi:hypothetical protein
MKETRLFISVLLIEILLMSLIGCSKTEDEEQQTSAPTEHEVVSTVGEFLKAIDSGDYDRAIGLGTPNEFKREGLVKASKVFELEKAEVIEAYVGNENAAVLTNSITTTQTPAQTVQFGFSLIKNGDGWLIRDLDQLLNKEDVQKWLSGFQSVEPNAKRVAGDD